MEFIKTEYEKLEETVYCGEHSSGLKVFVIPAKHNKSYAIIGTKYGSIDSDFSVNGENICVPDGIAHFLEHKLFEQPDGTNAFDDFAKTGASSNAFTGFNMTAYLFASTDNFIENLRILLGFVTTPTFTAENVQKEQGIIAQEIKMYEDDPGWRVLFNLLDGLYENNPVKKDIAGTVESISKIDKDILYTCYNTFYNPHNMAMVIVGDCDLAAISDVVDTYIKNSEKLDVKRLFKEESPAIHKKKVTQQLSVSTPMYLIGFKDMPGENMLKQKIVTQIALDILVGASSEIYTNLYSKGFINDTFESEYTLEKEFSFISVGGESTENAKPEEVYEYILKNIQQIDILDDSFNRAKKAKCGEFIRCFNSVEGLGNSYLKNYFRGIDIMKYQQELSSVTIDDVKNVQNKLFTEENSTLSIIYPY